MKEPIDIDRARTEFGIRNSHERMENGELRFRLLADDGNGYIRTVASPTGGWQHSHAHTAFREMYLVESGWMSIALTSADSTKPGVKIFAPGEYLVAPLGQTHNVYLPANAVIHTIKFGIRGRQSGWEPARWFDQQTRPLLEEQVMALANMAPLHL